MGIVEDTLSTGYIPEESISSGIVDQYRDELKEVVSVWVDKTIFTTVETYERLLNAKYPSDAIALYNHLLFTARFQKTNSVWANNNYIGKGLGWGRDRVKRAKKDLKDLKLIEYKQEIRKDHKFGKVFIVIKYIPSKLGLTAILDNRPTVDRYTDDPLSKCFKKEREMLKENKQPQCVVYNSNKYGKISFSEKEADKLGKDNIRRVISYIDNHYKHDIDNINGFIHQAIKDDWVLEIKEDEQPEYPKIVHGCTVRSFEDEQELRELIEEKQTK